MAWKIEFRPGNHATFVLRSTTHTRIVDQFRGGCVMALVTIWYTKSQLVLIDAFMTVNLNVNNVLISTNCIFFCAKEYRHICIGIYRKDNVMDWFTFMHHITWL